MGIKQGVEAHIQKLIKAERTQCETKLKNHLSVSHTNAQINAYLMNQYK